MRVGILTGEEHGTNYHRATLVKRAIERLGHSCFQTLAYSISAFQSADAVLLLRPQNSDALLSQFHALKRRGVPIVVDVDDLLFDIPTWSPSGMTFDRWDVQRFYRGVYACADVVTSPSRPLLSEIARHAPGAALHHVPNAFDPEQRLERPEACLLDKPNVGWAGGAQHDQDLAALAPAFDALVARGKKLTFIGSIPRQVHGKRETHFLSGCHTVELYHQTLAFAKFDVALAPLLDCAFNRCKSPLKAAEYRWIAGCPIVLSDVAAYDEVEADGRWVQKVRGFDASAWVAAVERGIEVLREEGRDYRLDPRYDLSNTAHQWVAAFEDAVRRARGSAARAAQSEVPVGAQA